jgi:glutathione synthase/RimK-type ligase-like ATP-grasp enzyme
MKIAIHDNKKERYFSYRWINYCKSNNISFKIVDAYDSNIVQQVSDCEAFMWHHSNYDYRDALFAKQLIYSIQQSGKKVFPDFQTSWHFDDKVGQKYLLESINAPLVPSYVFYTKREAIDWIKRTSFPKVFKLRGGSGSSNVKLVKNSKHAKRLVKKAFGRGFSQFDRLNHLKLRYNNFAGGKEDFVGFMKGAARSIVGTEYSRYYSKDKGYIYFQDFIPNNKFDTRIVVVGGEKAIGEIRFVRKGDFRASGSGLYSYENINIETVKIAIEISKKLNLQSVAYDFVLDENSKPLIVEMSYGFGTEGIGNAPGSWDSSLNWHKGDVRIQDWIIENLIQSIND